MPATKKKTKNQKKKNPLYVVTNEGKDVETAENFWDAIVKRFNLAPLLEVAEFLLQAMMKYVQSYAMLSWFIEELNNLNEALDKLSRKMAPWMYFYKV